jgi:hypothetical protein
MRIPPEEVRYSPLSMMDAGAVFRWRGKLYRAIPPRRVELVKRLFGCGLIDALVRARLFVPSRMTDLALEGHGLVVEHEEIQSVTYPREWTFSMLRDAGLLILELNELASRYGFQTQDCHSYNVLFRGEAPLYVDLGSFVQSSATGLLSLDEFRRSYCYPLRIWRSLGPTWGKQAVQRPGFLLTPEDYLAARWPFFRWPGGTTAGRALARIARLQSLPDETFDHFKARHRRWKVTVAALIRGGGRWQSAFPRLRRMLEALEPPRVRTDWSDYHDGLAGAGEEAGLTPRFRHVVERLSSLGVGSVLEIAANQGILSQALRRVHPALAVIATDRDAAALDKGYRAARSQGLGIQWAVLDPFFTERSGVEESPEERFRSEAVVALALTHHLLLTAGYSLDTVLEVLSLYSSRYVFVEFMPLGLHDGTAPVAVPSWYTQEWFQAGFERRFRLIERTQLEENRILFVGLKNNAAG